VSNRNDRFECHWRASRALCWGYGVTQLLAIGSIFTPQVTPLIGFALLVACLAHGVWVLPRHLLFTAPGAITGLRRSPAGWALYCREGGWRPARLMFDSLALPLLVIVRYRLPGQWWTRSVCIPADALDTDTHRRLRLRLRWSRKRFVPLGTPI
jgi:toxin CptA